MMMGAAPAAAQSLYGPYESQSDSQYWQNYQTERRLDDLERRLDKQEGDRLFQRLQPAPSYEPQRSPSRPQRGPLYEPRGGALYEPRGGYR